MENPKQKFSFPISELSGPPEVNFEMIHLAAYAKKHAPTTAMNAWSSPYIAAEFWIHKAALDYKVKQLSLLNHKINDLSKSVDESESKDYKQYDNLENYVEPEINDTNRSLPGFRTLLQCGKTSFDESLCNKLNSPGITSNISVAGRINRLFDESSVNASRLSPREKQISSTVQSVTVTSSTAAIDSMQRKIGDYSLSAKPIHNTNESSSIVYDNGELPNKTVSSTKDNVQHFERPITMHQNESEKHKLEPGNDASGNPSNFEIFFDPFGLETTNIEVNTISPTSNSIPIKVDHPIRHINEHLVLKTLSHNHIQKSDAESPSFVNNVNDTCVFELIDKNMDAIKGVKSTNPHQAFSKLQSRPLIGLDSPTALFDDIIQKVSQKRRDAKKC